MDPRDLTPGDRSDIERAEAAVRAATPLWRIVQRLEDAPT
jgi:hypothetical protein